jgi:hypothetical protein
VLGFHASVTDCSALATPGLASQPKAMTSATKLHLMAGRRRKRRMALHGSRRLTGLHDAATMLSLIFKIRSGFSATEKLVLRGAWKIRWRNFEATFGSVIFVHLRFIFGGEKSIA